jgi:hypothetical protein
MRLAPLALVVGLACRNDGAPSVTVVTTANGGPGAPLPQLTAIRDAAHRVMSARCGECHESHRPTAKPAALAVFDLDQPDWPSRFDAGRFDAGLRRFGAAAAEERQAFVALRDAELARR